LIEAVEAGAHEIDVVAAPRSGKTEVVKRIAKWALLERSQRVWIAGPTWDDVDRMYLPLWDEVQGEAQRGNTIIMGRSKESRIIRVSGGGFLEGISWVVHEQIQAQGIDVLITDESQYLDEKTAMLLHDRLEGDWLWIRIGRPGEDGASYYEEQALSAAAKVIPGRVGPITWPRWANPDPKTRTAIKIELGVLKALRKTLGKDHPEYKQRYRHFLSAFAGVSLPSSDIAISSFDRAIHVKPCPYDPELPVYLAIDPGYYPSYYAVAVLQPHPAGTMLGREDERSLKRDELWQIDEVYVQHTVTDDVINVCKKREWWGKVEEAVIDVAARQSNRQTGTSDIALWQQKGHFPVVADFVTIDDGLNTHRRWLTNNRLFHDPTNCPNTLREYLLYKVRARRIGDAKDTPIDANNHLQKAIAYFLVNHYGVTDAILRPVSWKRQTVPARRRQLA
jgi:hypothetical protein